MLVSYEENIYSNPDNLGYRTIEEIELSEPCYSFDLLVVWENKVDGTLWYATDSGCSCPSPFEETTVEDLRPFDYSEIESIVREGYGYEEMKASIEDSLRRLRKLTRERGL